MIAFFLVFHREVTERSQMSKDNSPRPAFRSIYIPPHPAITPQYAAYEIRQSRVANDADNYHLVYQFSAHSRKRENPD